MLRRSKLLLLFFILTFTGIVTFFLIGIIAGLAQVPIILLFFSFHHSSIIANWQAVRELAALISSIQTKILLRKSTWSLIKLAHISTIAMSNLRVIVFLSLKVFLVLNCLSFSSLYLWRERVSLFYVNKKAC